MPVETYEEHKEIQKQKLQETRLARFRRDQASLRLIDALLRLEKALGEMATALTKEAEARAQSKYFKW